MNSRKPIERASGASLPQGAKMIWCLVAVLGLLVPKPTLASVLTPVEVNRETMWAVTNTAYATLLDVDGYDVEGGSNQAQYAFDDTGWSLVLQGGSFEGKDFSLDFTGSFDAVTNSVSYSGTGQFGQDPLSVFGSGSVLGENIVLDDMDVVLGNARGGGWGWVIWILKKVMGGDGGPLINVTVNNNTTITQNGDHNSADASEDKKTTIEKTTESGDKLSAKLDLRLRGTPDPFTGFSSGVIDMVHVPGPGPLALAGASVLILLRRRRPCQS